MLFVGAPTTVVLLVMYYSSSRLRLHILRLGHGGAVRRDHGELQLLRGDR